MKSFFIPLFFLLFSWSAFAQEPENGSFEDISCKTSSGCDIYYFYDDCMGPKWHNANRAPRVLENECVFPEFETPFGDHVLQISGGGMPDYFFSRYGDAFFYDMEMLNCQSYELTFWAKTHYWDAWVGLEFYAVDEIEESTDLILNLFPLKLIDLTGGYDLQLAGQEWSQYTVTLDLNNTPSPFNLPPLAKYNHLLIVANHHGMGQIPAVVYLDSFAITPCTFDSEAVLYHHIDEEDCGNIDFTLDCDLASIKNYIWDFGDGSPLEQSTTPNISHLYQYAGDYTVHLSLINQDGCIDELTAAVKVSCDRCTGIDPAFDVSLESFQEVYVLDDTGEPIFLKYRCEYLFTDQSLPSPGHQIISWNWDFGNGNTSTEQSPNQYFDSGTNHTVCLTIEDDQNCTATICEEIEASCGRVKIPHEGGDQRSANQESLVTQWQVSPNPFQESIEVTPSSVDLESGLFKIFNIKGEEVFQKSVNTSGPALFDLHDLPKGLYFLVFSDQNGVILQQERIVKQ